MLYSFIHVTTVSVKGLTTLAGDFFLTYFLLPSCRPWQSGRASHTATSL